MSSELPTETQPIEGQPSHRLTRRQIVRSSVTIAILVTVVAFSPWMISQFYGIIWPSPLDVDGVFAKGDYITFRQIPVTKNIFRQALRKHPQATYIQFDNAAIDSGAMALIDQFSKLKNLGFSGKEPLDWQALPVLPLLSTLTIGGGRSLTNSDLASLARHPKLTQLSLYECRVTDEGIGELSKMTSLRSLSLNVIGLTDSCVNDLIKLSGLAEVQIFRTKLSATALCRLVEGLPGTRVKVYDMQGLQPTVHEWVTLAPIVVDNLPWDQVAEVRAWTENPPPRRAVAPRRLFQPPPGSPLLPQDFPILGPEYDVERSPPGYMVGVELVDRVATKELLDSLQKWDVPLVISWRPEEDLELIDQIVRLPRLRKLNIQLTSVKAAERLSLGLEQASSLEEVHLWIDESVPTNLSERKAEVATAVARIRNLTRLEGIGITEEWLPAFRGHPNLEALWLFAPKVTAELIDDLRTMPQLSSLHLYSMEPLTHSQVQALLLGRRTWQHLSVSVTDPEEQSKLQAEFRNVDFFFLPPATVTPTSP